MKYNIREIKTNEYELLKDFLYEAIFIPEGIEPPSRTIINQPELQIYFMDFGKQDDDTPSFAISLYKEYRGMGIGTEMMRQMLALLKKKGYRKASLAVQQANYAVKIYQRVGFEIVDQNEEEYIMICNLK